MADHDVAMLVTPVDTVAYIEMFFTQGNNKELYCFIPGYKNSVTIKNIATGKNKFTATWLENGSPLPVKRKGNHVQIDLSSIADKITDSYPLVIKLTGR